MRHRGVLQILFAMLVGCVCAVGAFGCQCGATYSGKSDWDVAMLATEKTNFVFEGTPVRWELKWSLLSAKDGEPIAADWFSQKDLGRDPRVAITFRVLRPYKGALGNEVTLYTGLGGGDCAATYATGLNYVVYAYGSNADDLGVSMCSPGGWTGSDRAATYLRYLRKERPTADDLSPLRHLSEESAQQREHRQRAWQEERTRLTAATGRICGKVVGLGSGEFGGSIGFLSTQGYSPAGYIDSQVKEDGSFCSMDLGPGKYYLYFVKRSDDGAAAAYYPGVNDVAKATALEILAGQNVSGIVFKLPKASAYTVRGFISADEKLDFGNSFQDLSVLLVRTDGDRRVWYGEKATRVLPKTAYFKISNVVPGRYAACAWGPTGWRSKKVEVNVTSHMKFIELELVHKK